jgi:hypothetical protein
MDKSHVLIMPLPNTLNRMEKLEISLQVRIGKETQTRTPDREEI